MSKNPWMLDRPPERHLLKRAIESAASLTGSTGGVAVGLLLGGPDGALMGAATGWAATEFLRAGTTVAAGLFSHRAEIRVGAVFLLADAEISDRLEAGEVPREDLREEITPGRSSATELVEAALMAAAQTFEERKLQYQAHLLAAIPFEPSLSPAEMNQLIGLAQTLTYRQLASLAAFASFGPASYGRYQGMGGDHLRGESIPTFEESEVLLSLRLDLLSLFHEGLVLVEQRTRREGRHSTVNLPWPAIPQEVNPDGMYLSSSGVRLVRLMRLDTMPVDDQETLVMQHLRWPPTP